VDLKAAAQTADPAVRRTAFTKILSVNQRPACIAELIIAAQPSGSVIWSELKKVTQTLQQNGSSAATSGSTSLASKPLTSQVLAFASDYGALTQSTSGQTTTVSGSLDGIPTALEAHSGGLFTECAARIIRDAPCVPTGLFDTLGRVSYSVALNSNSGSSVTGSAQGPPSGTAQLATLNSTVNTFAVGQITGKVVILQPKVKYENLTKALQSLASKSPFDTTSKQFIQAFTVLRDYQTDAGNAFTAWQTTAVNALSGATAQDIVERWLQQGPGLVVALTTAYSSGKLAPSAGQIFEAALSFASAWANYDANERTFYNAQLTSKPVLSFEYDDNRPTDQPSNSVFRLIYNQTAAGWTITLNGALSIYNATPSKSIPGSERLRDAQIAFEADHGLGKWGFLGTPTGSGTYYYQDQTSPAILNVNPSSPTTGVNISGLPSNATQVFAAKGPINIGQAKISFGSSGSGLRIPLAVTFSNRTELITKSVWRAQVGISYDFDSLLGK